MATVNAFADDHALLAGALMTLYETTSDASWFVAAKELCDRLIRLFHDPEGGGFFQYGSDAEELVVRPKDLFDNAVPSGNSAAAEALLRMGRFTGDASYERIGEGALRLVRDVMLAAPSGVGQALCALDLDLGPTYEVAVIGEPGAPATRSLVDEVIRRRWLPNVMLAIADPGAGVSHIPLLADRPQLDGMPTAYVCQRSVCRLPVKDPTEVAALLQV
jgi:uncharacterized protein YyaL (SSP411 family)